MNWQRSREFLAVPLATVLMLAAIPAGAGEVPAEEAFSLHLEDVVLLETPVVDTGSLEVVGVEEVPAIGITELQSTVLSDARTLSRAVTDQASAQTDKGGAGRWLKKHWYVPVLAAVILGAVLIGDDDDKDGEDD